MRPSVGVQPGFLTSLHDENGGVGHRYRASSTLHDVWVGLDAADCLTLREDRV
jgi:hypothetical protein